MARPQLGKAASRASDAVTRSDSTADGCCRLSVASTTSLILKPLGGNTLWVGGQACTIPSGGITLSGQTSLAAGTPYYVYATASGGAVNALVLSTTGHITGADGREYLSSGGSTPTAVTTSRLVGMVYTNTASAPFLDTPANRYLRNWFNRQQISARGVNNGAQTASTSDVGLVSLPFLMWADDPQFSVTASYSYYNSTANGLTTTTFYQNGTSVGNPAQSSMAVANQQVAVSQTLSLVASGDGLVSMLLDGHVNTGTSTWFNLELDATFRG